MAVISRYAVCLGTCSWFHIRLMILVNVAAILILLSALNTLLAERPGFKARSIKIEIVSISFVLLS